ncbi:MAG: hypothetical protein AUJ37_00995 [Candidatus Magasanikbacteria bacterium CG1_02_41_34]|nr:MAG: hypothetical protein AUJ37_00995 [Candidatus Magasanikbacteria bacterium CG1_02_41_34]
MGLFDIVLLIIIAVFAMFGIWFGFIHTLGSLLGTVVGAYVSSRYYLWLATWITHITGWSDNLSNVIALTIVFVVANRVIGFLFWLIERFFHPLSSLPFIGSINRFLGLVLGFFEGMITLGLIFYFIDKFPVGDIFMGWVSASVVVPYTLHSAEILLPLLPDAITQLKSTIDILGKLQSAS